MRVLLSLPIEDAAALLELAERCPARLLADDDFERAMDLTERVRCLIEQALHEAA